MVKRFGASDFSTYAINFERAFSYIELIVNWPGSLPRPWWHRWRAEPAMNDRGPAYLLRHMIPALRDALDGLEGASRAVGLSHPVARQLEHLRFRLSEFDSHRGDYRTLCAHAIAARQAVLDDIAQHLFLYVPIEDRRLYEPDGPPFGDEVERAFPNAKRDIEAAGRCIAVCEWTACVFHLMRVLQDGLVFLASRVDPKIDTGIENWHNIIEPIQKAIHALQQDKRSPERNAKLQAFSEAAVEFSYFKNAWRNHVVHKLEPYDEREARNIYQHVDSFMRTVATL